MLSIAIALLSMPVRLVLYSKQLEVHSFEEGRVNTATTQEISTIVTNERESTFRESIFTIVWNIKKICAPTDKSCRLGIS